MPDYLPNVTPANNLTTGQMMFGPPNNPGALPPGQFTNVKGNNLANWPERNAEPRGFPPDFLLALNKLMGLAPARVSQSGPMDNNPNIQPVIPSNQAYNEALAVLQAAKISQDAPQMDQVSMMSNFLRDYKFPTQ